MCIRDRLIVDEPASGLDPIGQVEMRSILKSLNDEGKSVLLSSHYLSEVENLCHEVAIMNKGTVIARGKIEDLLDYGNLFSVKASGLPGAWKPRSEVLQCETVNDIITIAVAEADLGNLIDSIRLSGGQVKEIKKMTKTLEELFVELVGGGSNGD
jgi:ABC-2 type transport system ATP-binding protein